MRSRVLVRGTPAPETQLSSPEWWGWCLGPRKGARGGQGLNAHYGPPQARPCAGCRRIREDKRADRQLRGGGAVSESSAWPVRAQCWGSTEERPAQTGSARAYRLSGASRVLMDEQEFAQAAHHCWILTLLCASAPLPGPGPSLSAGGRAQNQA